MFHNLLMASDMLLEYAALLEKLAQKRSGDAENLNQKAAYVKAMAETIKDEFSQEIQEKQDG